MLGKQAFVSKKPRGSRSHQVSSSHDNDRKIPRTRKEIYETNGMLAKEMENIFLKKGVPVIPSLGRRTSQHSSCGD